MDLKTAFDFTGKTAVVLGGSGVLCGQVGEALGAQGARVVVVGHSHPDRAQAVVEKIRQRGGSAIAVRANVLDRDSLLELSDAVLDVFGSIDILVNGAGGARREATTSDELLFFDLPQDAVEWVFDLNFLGTFLPCQVLGKPMVENGGGAILNFASMGAIRPLTRSVAYSAAKAAVLNFTRWLAVHMSQEYSSTIRVNALIPGFFLTEQNRFLLYDEASGALTPRGQAVIDHTPMARLGDPSDLVGPALFLLSDAARFVHGTAIVLDGGMSAYGGI